MKQFLLILLVIVCLGGCTEKQEEINNSLEIESYNTSFSLAQDDKANSNNQRFLYEITIVNNGGSEVKLKSFEPLLSDAFKKYVHDQILEVKVDEVIASGASIKVNGMILFDARELTKEDILNIKPFVKNIRIMEEKIIEISM